VIADYRNGTSALPLFRIFWPILKSILDQRSGKNSERALANYQNGASAIPLFCIFWPIFKNISRKRNYQIVRVDIDTDTDE
jgi:hypothetical protein